MSASKPGPNDPWVLHLTHVEDDVYEDPKWLNAGSNVDFRSRWRWDGTLDHPDEPVPPVASQRRCRTCKTISSWFRHADDRAEHEWMTTHLGGTYGEGHYRGCTVAASEPTQDVLF